MFDLPGQNDLCAAFDTGRLCPHPSPGGGTVRRAQIWVQHVKKDLVTSHTSLKTKSGYTSGMKNLPVCACGSSARRQLVSGSFKMKNICMFIGCGFNLIELLFMGKNMAGKNYLSYIPREDLWFSDLLTSNKMKCFNTTLQSSWQIVFCVNTSSTY